MSRDEIDIVQFANDINNQTANPDYRVHISDENLVMGAIGENIVDPIELTPRSK